MDFMRCGKWRAVQRVSESFDDYTIGHDRSTIRGGHSNAWLNPSKKILLVFQSMEAKRNRVAGRSPRTLPTTPNKTSGGEENANIIAMEIEILARFIFHS